MINKHNLSIARFAGENGRYDIDAVHITPKETISTDGSLMVRVTVPKVKGTLPEIPGIKPSMKFEPFSIPSRAALAIEKAIPKSKSLPVLNHVVIDGKRTDGGKQAVLAVTDMERTQIFQPTKMRKFVDYETVIPKKGKEVFSVDLSPSYLSALADSAARFTAGGLGEEGTVTLRFYSDGTAIRLDAHNEETGQDWTAVLMPRRK